MADLVTTEKEGVLVIHFATHRIWTEVEVTKISEGLANLAHAAGDKVLVDFTSIQQMSSAMLGKLLALSKECAANKISLRLCCLQPHIKEVITTTGLHKLLQIYDTQDSALAAFRKRRWLPW